MKKIFEIFVACFVGVFSASAFAACTSDQIDVLGDGTNCQNTKFTVTTTSLAAGDVFSFAMSAKGTFYVDCGADGTLSGTGASGKTVTRTNTTNALYTCTYTTGDVKTIRLSGRATGYAPACTYSSVCAAIRFGSPYTDDISTTYTLVAAIDGSLGAIFPTLGQSDTLQPQFPQVLRGCPIKSLPGTLFSGVTGNKPFMFFQAFIGCSQLTSIPENLFSGITGSASNLFRNAFWGTGITEIPANLFSGVYGGDGAEEMFFCVFRNCVNLTSIPAGLFSGVTTGAQSMFSGAFYGDTNLSGYIPPSTFAGLIANGSPTVTTMWGDIFAGTNVATSCPSGMTQYTTGYESAWGGRVSCMRECSGAEYWSELSDTCVDCPAGYDYNTTNGKISVDQCQANCATGQYIPTVPSDYTVLEYLESSGTQYIDTGVAPTNNTGIIIDFQYTNADSVEQIVTGAVGPNFVIGRGSGGSFYYAYRNGYGVAETTFPASAQEQVARYTAELNWKNSGVFKFWNYELALPANTFENSLPIYVFTASYSAISGVHATMRSGRVFSVKISNNSEIVRNMVPVRRNSDSVLGMYDTVTGTFFTNAGNGTFVAGPVGGAQCTDVGVGYTSTGGVVNFGSSLSRTPNTITISWAGANGTYETGSCTYGGGFNTPTTPPTRRGYRFDGWTFVTE